MKKVALLSLCVMMGFMIRISVFAQGQGGPNDNGICNHAEAIAKNDPVVSAMLDNWNQGCFRIDHMDCVNQGELLVLCAEHPCPAPVYLVELTYHIRSYLCAVLVPPPGYVKVQVIVGPGGGSATILEAPFY